MQANGHDEAARNGMVGAMSEGELRRHCSELARAFAEVFAGTAAAFAKLAEFDRLGCSAMAGAQSTAHYLHMMVGLAMGTAREHVRVALALEELPLTQAAFAAGRVSYSKVRAITRIATRENESPVLNWAMYSTAKQLDRLVQGCINVSRAQAKKQSEARKVEWGVDHEGMFYLRAHLLADEGARVIDALEKAMPRREKGQTSGHHRQQQRADGLMVLVRGLGGDEVGGDRTELIVHVEVPSESNQYQESCQVQTAHGEMVSVGSDTARRAGCDASVVVMVQDRDGAVLDVGRKTRKIPAGMRRALQVRDKGCRYPGCPNTMVDAHHLKHWADGGETKLENLMLLCRFHHGQLHEGGFVVEMDNDGQLRWTRRSGEHIEANGALPAVSTLPQRATEPWNGVPSYWRGLDYSYVSSTFLHRFKIKTPAPH